MGWWDNISSFSSGLSDNVWKLESLLQGFVREYALWGASQANKYFSILNHTWSDVRGLIDDEISGYYSDISDFYYVLSNKLENDYSILEKSWYNITNYVDDAVKGFQTQINGLSQDVDNINDSLNIVTRTAKTTVSYIAYEAERRWSILGKTWTDITSLINSNFNTLKTDIINPMGSKIVTLGNRVDVLVNITIKNIASDVTGLSIKLNKLTNDVVNPLKTDLGALSVVVNGFPTWITKTFDQITEDFMEQFIKTFNASENTSVRFLTALGIGAGEVITTILDTPRDMVTWIKNDIADVFEDILDRVFK